MLTARANPEDRITGLEIGADDYLPKPFEPRELMLRLGNILRRSVAATPPPQRAGARERSASAPSPSASTAASCAASDEVIRITEREREILTILGHRAGANVAARGARRRRQRRERAHRRRADQPAAPQDRGRSGQPGLSPDRPRRRLPPARRLMLMRLRRDLAAPARPLRPLRALARARCCRRASTPAR